MDYTMDLLQRCVSPTSQESIGEELEESASSEFEERMFYAPTDQHDYVGKILRRTHSLEAKAQASPATAIHARLEDPAYVFEDLLDPGATMQMQNLNDGVQLPEVVSGQDQQRQELSNQSLHNNLNASVMRRSIGIGTSNLSDMTTTAQTCLSKSSGRRWQQQHHQQKQPPQQQASALQQHFLYQQSPQQQQQQQQSLEQKTAGSEGNFMEWGRAFQVPVLQQPTNLPQIDNVPSAIQRQQIAQAQLFQQQRQEKRRIQNREAARRSHLKKQAQCEELRTRVDTLTAENMALRTEFTRLSEERKKLTAENTSLLGQFQKAQEDDAEAHPDDGLESKEGSLSAVASEGHERILDMSSERT